MAESGSIGKRLGCLALVFVWLLVFAGMAVAFKYWVVPAQKQANVTGEDTQSPATPEVTYDRSVAIGLDHCAGYAPLRSSHFRKQLAQGGIGLTLREDREDHVQRFAALGRDLQYATFSLNGYLRLCLEQDRVPGQIVAVLAESHGADALVAHSQAVPDLLSLNRRDLQIVYRRGTPSEFLARVLVASFDLPELGDNWGQPRPDNHDILKELSGADPTAPRAFVLWEPELSTALKKNGVVRLIDSSRMQGFLLDVLVASPEAIADVALTRTLVSAWFDALGSLERTGLKERIIAESAKHGKVIDVVQGHSIVDGISWKTLADNRAYFDGDLEASLNKVLDVLIETGAVADSATERDLIHSGIIDALMPPNEEVAAAKPKLETLTVDAWDDLVVVGRAKVPTISFARGRADISRFSRRPLDKLATTLNSFAGYYIKIIGNARQEGDSEANKALAKGRAEAVRSFLIEKGVQPDRMRAETGLIAGAAGQSVTFALLEKP